MIGTVLLAAAKPWTYWLAPLLLIAALVTVLVLAVGYYRKVLVPGYQWRLWEEQRRRSEQRPPATLHRLPAWQRPEQQAA